MTTEPIGSKNHRLKRLRRLSRQRKARSQERAFVVEGRVLVAEAMKSQLEVEEVFYEGTLDPAILGLASLGTTVLRPVFEGTLNAVLDTVTSQNVAAVVETPSAPLTELDQDRPILVLVDVSDPGNVGTLLRTAEASGCSGVVLAGESVDPTNPKVVRAAAGALFRLPVVSYPDAVACLQAIRETGRAVAATVVASETSVDVVDYDQIDLATAAIVLGNEAHGLPEDVSQVATVLTTIPLAGPTESLNVAAAGAVMCFSSWQQRRR